MFAQTEGEYLDGFSEKINTGSFIDDQKYSNILVNMFVNLVNMSFPALIFFVC